MDALVSGGARAHEVAHGVRADVHGGDAAAAVVVEALVHVCNVVGVRELNERITRARSVPATLLFYDAVFFVQHTKLEERLVVKK